MCRSKMESERVKYEPGCHEALSLPNNSSCVIPPVEVQGYSAHVTTMGNMVFPPLAHEVSMGHGLPLLGLSDDLTIGIDDLLNKLEQFELGVPFFCEGSSLEGRGVTNVNSLPELANAERFASGEGLLPSSSVDVTTRKGLVDMFVQGVKLQWLYEDLLADLLSMANSLKKDLEVNSKLCGEITSMARWRELDLHTTQAVLEELNHMIWVQSELNADVSSLQQINHDLNRNLNVVKGIAKIWGKKAHSFTSQPCANDDQIISQKTEEVIDEHKHTEWRCVNELISDPSPQLLRRALCVGWKKF
ncbi:hypothetical protein Tco_1514646 [Tanacetum coccineum]